MTNTYLEVIARWCSCCWIKEEVRYNTESKTKRREIRFEKSLVKKGWIITEEDIFCSKQCELKFNGGGE